MEVGLKVRGTLDEEITDLNLRKRKRYFG